MLVDTIDDAVGARYSGMPSRLYLIDREGKVAYKSGRGPFGFKPAELEQSLVAAPPPSRIEPEAKTSTDAAPGRKPRPMPLDVSFFGRFEGRSEPSRPVRIERPAGMRWPMSGERVRRLRGDAWRSEGGWRVALMAFGLMPG